MSIQKPKKEENADLPLREQSPMTGSQQLARPAFNPTLPHSGDPRQLLLDTYQQIQTRLSFDAVVLLVLTDSTGQPTPDGNHCVDLSAWVMDQERYSHPKAGLTAKPFSYQHTPLGTLLRADAPRLYDWSSFAKEIPALVESLLWIPVAKRAEEVLVAPLPLSERAVGFILVTAEQRGLLNQEQISILSAVADQLAFAISTMLAYQEILEREREKTAWAAISKAIATIPKKDELWNAIIQQVGPLIGFRDTIAATYSQDYSRYQYTRFAGSMTAVPPQETMDSFREFVPLRGTSEEWVLQQGDVCSLTLEQAEKLARRDPEMIDFLRSAGIGYTLFVKLRTGGKLIGVQHYYFTDAPTLTPRILALAQSATELMAVALSNAMSLESLREREREKALLLALSAGMGSIRDRDDLRQLILDQIKPVIGFDAAIITIHDATAFRWLIVAAPERWSEGSIRPLLHSPYAFILSQMKIHEVVWWDTAAMQAAYPTHPVGELLAANHLYHNVYRKLVWMDEIIGSISWHFSRLETSRQVNISLFQSLADQLAIAVAGILAHEETQQRACEQQVLLAIGEAIARVRSSNELLLVICNQVRALIPFKGYRLFVVHETEKYFQLIISSRTDELSTEQRTLSDAPRHRYKGSAAEYFCGDFRLVSYRELTNRFPAHANQIFPPEQGIQALLGGPLYSQGELIGFVCIQHDQADYYTQLHLRLFKAIADQVAVAVANILVNEQIEQWARNKALQVDVLKALPDTGGWPFRLQSLYQALQPYLPFQMMGFLLADRPQHSCWLTAVNAEQFQIFQQENFPAAFGLPLPRLEEILSESESVQPRLLNGPDYRAYLRRVPALERISSRFELASGLLVPVRLEKYGQALLFLLSCSAEVYSRRHYEMATYLADVFALRAQLLLANEDLLHYNQQLQQENFYLRQEIRSTTHHQLIGRSPLMQQLHWLIEQVAPTTTTVLISGETGTGKELVARAIHAASPRCKHPLIKLNCAALPRELAESELFGHEKGAFTGAVSQRIGKFELADGGTLFLDEIGELPLELQAKLLRALQEKEVERLGGNKVFMTDVRILAATNRDLAREVEQGRFRADLFYRLSVFPLQVPALRERKEDIPQLVEYLIGKHNQRLNKQITGVSIRVLQELQAYPWPGNVRQLEHVLERGMILSEGQLLKGVDLPTKIAHQLREKEDRTNSPESFGKTLAENEREYILHILQLTGGRIRGKGGAAELLDLPPTTLEARMKRLGIHK